MIVAALAMNPALTQFGAQMSHLTGVRAIMKDIIETLRAGSGQDFINLSAGNPVILPEVEQLWRDCTAELLASPEYGEVVCRYGSSQGYQPFIDAVLNDFNLRYGLNLTDRNILITPGSQSIYFYAANAFGGYTTSKQLKNIVLPPMSLDELEESIDWHAEEHIPYDLADVNLDYHITGEDADRRVEDDPALVDAGLGGGH